jgi:single-strand DNA-binding protein
MNSVNLIGRAGSDIELRYLPKGTAVADVNLAVTDGYGEHKKTLWIGITFWGKTAETASKYVKKTTSKKNRKTKVTAESLHFIASNKSERDDRQDQKPPRSQAPPQSRDDEDDIPF